MYGLSPEPFEISGFSLYQSIDDMWNAGVYPLAILVAFFSGGWPYIKLILMLVSWMLNEK